MGSGSLHFGHGRVGRGGARSSTQVSIAHILLSCAAPLTRMGKRRAIAGAILYLVKTSSGVNARRNPILEMRRVRAPRSPAASKMRLISRDPGPLDLLGIQHRESPNIPQVAKEPAKAGQEAADRDRPKTGIHEVPFI